jgi:hypothetical protein
MHRTTHPRHRLTRWTALVGLTALAAVPGFSTSAVAAVPAPSITNLLTARAVTTGGTYLWVQGTGFTRDTTLTVDGLPAQIVRVVDPTQLTAIAPAHIAGLAQLVVTNSGGSSPSGTTAQSGAPNTLSYAVPPSASPGITTVSSPTLNSATGAGGGTVSAGSAGPASYLFVDGVPRLWFSNLGSFPWPIHAPGTATVVAEDANGWTATPTTATYTATSTTTLTVPTIHGFASSVTLPAGTWTPIYPMLLGTLSAGATPVAYTLITPPAPDKPYYAALPVTGPVNLTYSPPATFGSSTSGVEPVQFINTTTGAFLQMNFMVGNSSGTANGTFTPQLGIGPCLLLDSGSAVQFGNVTVGASAPTLGDVSTVVRSCSAAGETVLAQPSAATSPATNATYVVKGTTTPGANEVSYAITGTGPRTLLDSTLAGGVSVASLTAAGTTTGGDTASLRHDVQVGPGSTATGSAFTVAITLTAVLAAP